MKKGLMAAMLLGVVMLTGCSVEQRVTIKADLSSDVVMDSYTTKAEEDAIMQSLKDMGSTEEMTFADMMKSMEFTYSGTEIINGELNNCYTTSAKNTTQETKSMFVELTGKKAVMDISTDSQTATEDVTGTTNVDYNSMGFFYYRVTYPFKVAKSNGQIQPDGYTVLYDIKKMQKKKISRAYALSASAFKNADNITVKGVTNKKAYKKPMTVKVSSKGVVASFKVNGKAQTGNSFYASKDGKNKVTATTATGKKKTVTFYVDRKKPTTNIKNNKTYKKTVKITFKDSISGIKKATLNGKKIKSGKKVKNNGTYTLKITDKAGNVKTVKFTIHK